MSEDANLTYEGFLTEKEINLREWLRDQPGGTEAWLVIKAGFRRSYEAGAREARAAGRPATRRWRRTFRAIVRHLGEVGASVNSELPHLKEWHR